jgi:hypothetical protein
VSDLSIQVIPDSAQRVSAMMGGMTSYLRNFTRDMLFQEAALCANAFIKFTPPFPKGGGFSTSPKARKQGESSVDADIRAFVAPKTASMLAVAADPSADFSAFIEWRSKPLTGKFGPLTAKIHADQDAERAYRKAKNLAGKFPYTERVLDDTAKLKEVHDYMRRRYRGRIRHNNGPPQQVRSRPFLLEPDRITSYVKERQKRVGVLNSGWWNVILKVPAVRIRGADRLAGRQGIPEWVKRHANSLGTFTNGVGAVASTSSFVVIANAIGDINGIAADARTRAKVLQFRQTAHRLRPMQKLIDQACLTANRGQRPN